MDASIGERVQKIRKSLDLTQAELADKLGISLSAMKNVEYGRLKAIPNNTLKLISNIFNINYNWIMTGKGEMYPDFVNPVADRINDLLEGENETAKAFFRMFARFSAEDWELLQRFIDKLKKEESE